MDGFYSVIEVVHVVLYCKMLDFLSLTSPPVSFLRTDYTSFLNILQCCISLPDVRLFSTALWALCMVFSMVLIDSEFSSNQS